MIFYKFAIIYLAISLAEVRAKSKIEVKVCDMAKIWIKMSLPLVKAFVVSQPSSFLHIDQKF